MASVYDPKRVIVTVGGSPILGFASGTFIEVERSEDAVNLMVGTQGEYAWALNRNKSGTITLTLMHTAQSNDILSAMARAGELTGLGGRPLSVNDTNGRTLVSAPEVWVQKLPNLEYGNEVGNREWVLIAGDLDIAVGGNLV